MLTWALADISCIYLTNKIIQPLSARVIFAEPVISNSNPYISGEPVNENIVGSTHLALNAIRDLATRGTLRPSSLIPPASVRQSEIDLDNALNMEITLLVAMPSPRSERPEHALGVMIAHLKPNHTIWLGVCGHYKIMDLYILLKNLQLNMPMHSSYSSMSRYQLDGLNCCSLQILH